MPRISGNSKPDIALRERGLYKTYVIEGSGKQLRFMCLDINKYQNLDTGEIYTCARDILLAHAKLHQGPGIGYGLNYFTITSGPDRGKKLSEV